MIEIVSVYFFKLVLGFFFLDILEHFFSY